MTTAARGAKWWADKVYGGPIDQKITRRDGTDKESERTEDMVNLLGLLLGNTADASKRDAFEIRLAELIQKEIDRSGECRMYVDYDPQGVLYIVDKEFNPGYGSWPFKTGMDVTMDKVDVKEGYGAGYVTLPPE